ncbi:MAG TPA: ABC transporter permease [Terriglobales bacterium]|nr:ABC transporter permease [Terriglobales bacterium]
MALFSDIPFALRMLRKTPGFTAAAVVTLALAIGANTALFTVIDAVLLTPLPYAQPERLVAVWEHGPTGFRNSVSVPTFLDWRAGAKSFAELAASTSSDMTLLHGDRPQDVTVAQVTPNYFNMLGLGAALGRAFVAEDGTHGREHSVLLTSAAWRALFGGEQGIVGQSVSLNGSLYTVIGVLPPNPLLDDGQQQMFSPLVLQEGESRKTHSLLVYGRLAPGATLASAQAEMDVIASGIASRYPDSNRGWGVQVDRLRDTLVGSTLRNSLLLLFGAVGFILLVGSANVANLMLVRATARQKEFSIRAALGASSAPGAAVYDREPAGRRPRSLGRDGPRRVAAGADHLHLAAGPAARRYDRAHGPARALVRLRAWCRDGCAIWDRSCIAERARGPE